MDDYPRLETLQRPRLVALARRNPPFGSDSSLDPRAGRLVLGPEDRWILPEMEASARLAAEEPTGGRRWTRTDPVTGEVLEWTGTGTLKPDWMRDPDKRGYFGAQETLAVLGELKRGRWPRTAKRERIAEQISQALHLNAEAEKARALGGPETPAPEEEAPEFVRTSGESRPRVRVDFGKALFTTRPRSPFKGTIEHVNPRRPPIRYSKLTEEERQAIIDAYKWARQFPTDPLHAAAIAANQVFRMSNREWNSDRGADAFGAAVAVLAFRKAMQVNPRRRRPSRAIYCPERLESPGRFDPRSFRTVQTDGHLVTIGCPRGQYDARAGRCRVGTRAQRILHPPGERACPLPGREVRNPEAGPIRAGDRVTFLDRRSGRPLTGRVVFALPTHLTLNMGGPYGTPQVVHYDQVIRVARGNPLTRAETAAVLRSARRDTREATVHPRGSRRRAWLEGAAAQGKILAAVYGQAAMLDPKTGRRTGRRALMGRYPERFAVQRNPRVLGTIPGRMTEIRYNRTGRHPGPYYHKFSRGVQAFRLSDGSVLLRGRKPLWVSTK